VRSPDAAVVAVGLDAATLAASAAAMDRWRLMLLAGFVVRCGVVDRRDYVRHAAVAVLGRAELAWAEPKQRRRDVRLLWSAVLLPRPLPCRDTRVAVEQPVVPDTQPRYVRQNPIPNLERGARPDDLSTSPCCACNTSVREV